MAAAIRLSQQHSCSFDHLVGANQKRGRHSEAKCFGGLEIDDQLKLRGLLDRQISMVRTLQYLVDVCGGAPE
jgi:hypothetical protein